MSEGKEYNVFQTVKLTCEGTAPRLTASLNTSACDSFVKRYVTFHISPEQSLNNGDKVIVTADWSRSEAAKNLYLITKERQEYTVSNQPTYLTTLREEKLPGLTFFIFLLLYTLFACVSFFYIFTSKLPGMDVMSNALGQFGLSAYALKSYLPSLDTLTTVYRFIKLIGMLPIVLTCIGIWTFYLACKNPGDTLSRSNGLLFIQIPVIISFVGSALGPILIMIGGGVLTFALHKWWIFLIAFALCLTSLINLFYDSMVLRLLLNAKQILENPRLSEPSLMAGR